MNYDINMYDHIKEVLLTEEQIKARVKEMADKYSKKRID